LRVLILVDCYYPSTKSSAKLIHDLGVELYRQGNEVLVLSPSDSMSERLTVSNEDGIGVVRVKTGKIKGTSRALRAMREGRLSANLWHKAKDFLRRHPCELIIFYSPSIFFGSLVRKLKHIWNCPAYLILRDIFPQWAVDAGILKDGLMCRGFRHFEQFQYEVADCIAVQSPGDLAYFHRMFPHKRFQLEVLYNWTSLHEPNLLQGNQRTKLGLQNKVVFFYGGNIGEAQDMDNILRLAARLSWCNGIHFLLVGDGSEVVRLKQSIVSQGLRNIQILPAVSQSEYLSMVSEFDVGLVSLHPRLKTHNIPGKLLGYLYWGMPVLASINPGNDLGDLLRKNRAGFCFVNGDDEKLSMAAQELANDIRLRSQMGKNARRLLEHTFSVEVAVNQVFAHLQRAGFHFSHSSSAASVSPSKRYHQVELIT
jgi:O26-antigen biosynthesis N-acetyl-L-fucosamine transferase